MTTLYPRTLWFFLLPCLLCACDFGASSSPSAPSSRVILGPIVGAQITAVRASSVSTAIETTTTLVSNDLNTAGGFTLSLPGVADSEFILVTVIGGRDIDADGDGTLDATPTPNNGVIRALATAADWRAGVHVTVFTEIQVQQLIGNNLQALQNLTSTAITQSLDTTAQRLLHSDADVNGDGQTNYRDTLQFTPTNNSFPLSVSRNQINQIAQRIRQGESADASQLIDNLISLNVAAGADQTVEPGNTVTLNGSAQSSRTGAILSYAWTQTGGTTLTLNNANSADASFTVPSVSTTQTLIFLLTVADGLGITATDSVRIQVDQQPVPNAHPSVAAGADQTVTEGASVSLSGTATDSDGTIARVQWSQTTGPSVTLNTAESINASFTAPQVDTSGVSLSFTVTATDDNGASSSDSITVTVNDIPPPANIIPVATAQALSVDEDGSVSVTLSGTDADGSVTGFAISAAPANGSLSGTAPNLSYTPNANFNGSDQFTFTVTDNQMAVSSPAMVSITVNSVNDLPTANAGPDQAVGEQTIVALTATASSDSDGTIASYAWVETSGSGITLSNAATATASFTAPTFATDTALTFRLTVTDNQGGVSTDDIAVTVQDVNNQAPVITSANSASVAENTTVVLTLTATDADTTGEATVFTLGGDDASLFTVTGSALAFTAAPDFDTPVCGGDNACTITATPSDGINTGVAQAITITVTDLNDTAPVITSANSASVAENSTIVLTLVATDADTTGEATVFTLGGDDASLFTVTGSVLAFTVAPDFETPVCGGDNACTITATPSDGINTGVAQAITITVTDLNDTAPVITSANSASVAENTTVVLTLTATDADTTGEATVFTLGGDDAGLFTVTGSALAFTAAPDFETPVCGGDNVCTITATPSDGINTGVAQAITITVTDLNDTAPVITSANSASVAENTTVVLTLTATDADTTGEATVFTLGGDDASLFTVTGSVLAFTAAPDFETPVCGGDNVCTITATPSDSVNTGVAQAITITVTDLNDTAPVITSANSASVAENSTIVLTLVATDADTTGEATVFILGGDDASLFTVTGSVLAFTAAPDFETPVCGGDNVCTITATPGDSVNTGVAQAITITVTGLPTLTLVDASTPEGDTGTSTANITVTLAQFDQSADVSFTVTDGTATLTDNDYSATASGTLSFTGGATTATIPITVNGDTRIETDETVTITLSNPVNAELAVDTMATLTITNDDFAALNDTGIQFAGVFPNGNNSNCSDNPATNTVLAQQDCTNGRDAQATAGTLIKVGGGQAGFDFTKLGGDGTPLTIQNATYSDTGNEANGTMWSCVRDNRTGLVWEVKTAANRNTTYRWGGLTAVGRTSLDRQGSYFDDWNTLVNTANANTGLCGFTDWRVPKLYTLQTIVNKGRFNLAIDSSYFPNIGSGSFYWSSSPLARLSNSVWFIDFNNGNDFNFNRDSALRVRLVRGGQ